MLLSKTLRSSTLKLAFIYVLVFSSGVFALLGYVHWSTATYLYEKSDQLLNIERESMDDAYRKTGRDGIIALIGRRIGDKFFADWAYLLTTPIYQYVAGNLGTWPRALHPEPGWTILVTLHPEPENSGAALRAASRVLPDGSHLLIGRKTEDLHGLLEKIATALAWGVGSGIVSDSRRCGRHIHITAFGGADRSDQCDQSEHHARRIGRTHPAARDRR